jgi:uncharacterized Zn finger protein (UPF0148 family)
MNPAECTRCGSNEFYELDGYIICAYCRSKYSPAVEDVSVKETTIGVHSDIQLLLQKCKEDPANRRRYASLILDLDPTNQEAAAYLR